MLFQLFGSQSLVQLLVRHPLCNAEQPAAALQIFTHGWQIFRDSAEGIEARKDSQKKTERHGPRLSVQIHHLKQRQVRGQWIANWIDEDSHHWNQLSEKHQTLWSEHNSGAINRQISELRMEQKPRYHGAAESMCRSSAARPERPVHTMIDDHLTANQLHVHSSCP